MSVSVIICILLAIFIGAFVRTYFGFGEALVSMPLLALIGLDLHSSISIIGLAGLIVAFINISSDFKNIHYKLLCFMFLGSLIGIPVGIWMLHHIDTTQIQIYLALFLIIYGLYAFFKITFRHHKEKRVLKSPLWSSIAGFISGILGSLYNSHGVPIVIYASFTPYTIKAFKSTIQAHFVLTAIFVVIGQAFGGVWTSKTLPLLAMSLPLLIFAVVIGKWLSHKTPHQHFEKWIYLFIVLLGVLLIVSQI